VSAVLYEDATETWGLVEGDSLTLLKTLPAASVDCVVCDPPYAISFTDAAWDGRTIQAHAKHLSPAAAFSAWTEAWAAECRRVLKPGGYLLAFGAPRTFHRLTVGIEDAGLAIRDVLMWLNIQGFPKSRRLPGGRGTALKPAYEPILCARAPLAGTTAANLNAWGTGTLNITAAGIGEPPYWPTNVILSHADGCMPTCCSRLCPVRGLDRQRPGATRHFFCAKATREEREAGCAALPKQQAELFSGKRRPARLRRNTHPTVKPISLMRWLVRLACPPQGIVLDPFAGSCTTGVAAVLEGRQFLGLEREAAYVDIALARLTHWAAVAAQEEVLP
jgi:DNA modification methylase